MSSELIEMVQVHWKVGVGELKSAFLSRFPSGAIEHTNFDPHLGDLFYFAVLPEQKSELDDFILEFCDPRD